MKITKAKSYRQKVPKSIDNGHKDCIIHKGNLGVIHYAEPEDFRGKYREGGATKKLIEAERKMRKTYPKAEILVAMPVLVFRIGD